MSKRSLSAIIHSPKPVIKHVERCLSARFANVCSETFCSRTAIIPLLLPKYFNQSSFCNEEASCNTKYCLQTTCQKSRKTQDGKRCCGLQTPNRYAKCCWFKQVQGTDDLLGMWAGALQFGSAAAAWLGAVFAWFVRSFSFGNGLKSAYLAT